MKNFDRSTPANQNTSVPQDTTLPNLWGSTPSQSRPSSTPLSSSSTSSSSTSSSTPNLNALSSLLGSNGSNSNNSGNDLGYGDELFLQMASTHPELVSSVFLFFILFIFLVITVNS